MLNSNIERERERERLMTNMEGAASTSRLVESGSAKDFLFSNQIWVFSADRGL